MERDCPEHINTGLTPKDATCHNHASDMQQRLHNFHCAAIGCQHALKGKERHPGTPTLHSRNLGERILNVLG